VLDSSLKDPAFVAKMAKFLKASFKGWDYAVKHPQEAAKIVVAEDASGPPPKRYRLARWRTWRSLSLTPTRRKSAISIRRPTVAPIDVLLHSGGDTPVIKKDPGDSAMTHTVWDAAAKLK
jgi:NitT/TauT family transport system substrate-binding protein